MTLLAKASIQYGCTNQSNQNQAYDCRNSFVGTKYNDKIKNEGPGILSKFNNLRIGYFVLVNRYHRTFLLPIKDSLRLKSFYSSVHGVVGLVDV